MTSTTGIVLQIPTTLLQKHYENTTKTLRKHYGCTTGLQATGHYRSLQLLQSLQASWENPMVCWCSTPMPMAGWWDKWQTTTWTTNMKDGKRGPNNVYCLGPGNFLSFVFLLTNQPFYKSCNDRPCLTTPTRVPASRADCVTTTRMDHHHHQYEQPLGGWIWGAAKPQHFPAFYMGRDFFSV